jgi:hypothetical protein
LNPSIWLLVFAGAVLIAYLLLQRSRSVPQDDSPRQESPARLAALVGVRRAWGEGDASLLKRATALCRWPYSAVPPEVAWWARWLTRVRAPRP